MGVLPGRVGNLALAYAALLYACMCDPLGP